MSGFHVLALSTATSLEMQSPAKVKVKHAYILGAGFSVPLGGPLFNDLLSIRLLRFYDHLFDDRPPNVNEASWNFVRRLPVFVKQALQKGVEGEGYPRNLPSIDVNAEQLLEFMEAMAHGKTNWLCRLLRSDVNTLGSSEQSIGEKAKIAFRLLKVRLAIEVVKYLDDVPRESDRWLPYHEWFASLGSDDTIITTNYDPVLEMLASVEDSAVDFSTIHFDGQIRSANNKHGIGLPSLFKIHGSYDWQMVDGEIQRRPVREISDLFERDIAIGTPGLEKFQLLSDPLSRPWAIAKERLKQAHVVSIVGYSLPETDNLARMDLLEILGMNPDLKSVNIVLGARNERGVRAKSLVEQVTRYRADVKVRLLPIYAQDYLHAYRPECITDIENQSFE